MTHENRKTLNRAKEILDEIAKPVPMKDARLMLQELRDLISTMVVRYEAEEIVKDIVIWPKPWPSNKRYPWRELEIGESFRTEIKPLTMASQCSKYGKHLDRVFSYRVLYRGKKQIGTMVWRTA